MARLPFLDRLLKAPARWETVRPVSETASTVTLTRDDYQLLLDALHQARDLLAAGPLPAAAADSLPAELADRLARGDHPLRVWRDYRGLTGTRLAELAGLPQSYVSEIETGRKPGSLDAMAKLARALGIRLDDLVPGG